MVSRDDLDVHTAASGVLPVEQPVWTKRGQCIGSAAYWEQRYWHAELNEDGRTQRSQEHKRELQYRLVQTYGLDACDISRPSDSKDAPQTIFFSSKDLISWLLHKRHCYASRGNDFRVQTSDNLGFLRRFVLPGQGCIDESG